MIEFDCHTVAVADFESFATPFKSVITHDSMLNAFGGWFDTSFNGSPAEPTPNPVTLTTSRRGVLVQ